VRVIDHAVIWRRTLDAILDSLERRYERRRKQCDRALDALLAVRKAGKKDAAETANYIQAHSRAEEARLAFNSALAADTAEREIQ
jgi:hypothetical protein